MKLTSEQLKRIIAEEVSRTLGEAPYGRRGVGYDFRRPPGGAGNTGYRERGFEGDAPAAVMGGSPVKLDPSFKVVGVTKTEGSGGCVLQLQDIMSRKTMPLSMSEEQLKSFKGFSRDWDRLEFVNQTPDLVSQLGATHISQLFTDKQVLDAIKNC